MPTRSPVAGSSLKARGVKVAGDWTGLGVWVSVNSTIGSSWQQTGERGEGGGREEREEKGEGGGERREREGEEVRERGGWVGERGEGEDRERGEWGGGEERKREEEKCHLMVYILNLYRIV